MESVPRYFAGVELGGTKTLVVLAREDAIVQRRVLETRSPHETLAAANAILTEWEASAGLCSVGIASFGPIQLRSDQPDFGKMLPTPKLGWTGASVLQSVLDSLNCPYSIDTDVNGAVLAECRWGSSQNLENVCYLTIGTGLGGGLLIGGMLVHGAMHPEIGHVRVSRIPGDNFPGICRFHGDCVEGLVSGPALAARFGAAMEDVADDDARWQYVAADLAELVSTLLLTLAPQAILFGGSVAIRRPFLLAMIRDRALERLNGYLPFFDAVSAADIIRLASLGEDAGPLGAIALAQQALSKCPP